MLDDHHRRSAKDKSASTVEKQLLIDFNQESPDKRSSITSTAMTTPRSLQPEEVPGRYLWVPPSVLIDSEECEVLSLPSIALRKYSDGALMSRKERRQSAASCSALSDAPPPFRLKQHRFAALQREHRGSGGATAAERQKMVRLLSAAQTPQPNPLFQIGSEYIRVMGVDHAYRKFLSKQNTTESRDSDAPMPRDFGYNRACESSGGGVSVACVSETQPLDVISNGKSPLAFAPRRKSIYWIREMQGESIRPESASERLKLRQETFVRRHKACECSLLAAILGFVFMMVECELCAFEIIVKDGNLSIVLKTVIVFSTLMLLISLVGYHRFELKLAQTDSGADDWRVVITGGRIRQLLFEMLVCAICPIPYTGYTVWPNIVSQHCSFNTTLSDGLAQNSEREVVMHRVSVDVILSIPMFLRSYLLGRYVVLHSHLFKDSATRSIAALNRVAVDFKFVIRTKMHERPLSVLISVVVVYCVAISWLFTQCERFNVEGFQRGHDYMNALWFVVVGDYGITLVTFLTIGYGDIIPNTYCGRALGIATGIMGAGVSSALIAVIGRSLDQTKPEKHVNAFMADSNLTKQRRDAAAMVIQQTWFIYKHRYLQMRKDDSKIRTYQRKFLTAINEFRKIKEDQRKLNEENESLVDVGRMHKDVLQALYEVQQSNAAILQQLASLSERVTLISPSATNQKLSSPTDDVIKPNSQSAAADEKINNNPSCLKSSRQNSAHSSGNSRRQQRLGAFAHQASIGSTSTRCSSKPVSFDIDTII